MLRNRTIAILAGTSAFALIGVLAAADDTLPVEHAECTFFGANTTSSWKRALEDSLTDGWSARQPGSNVTTPAM